MKSRYLKKDISFMKTAFDLCKKSMCGYNVGAVLVQNNKVLVEAFNDRLLGNMFCNDGTCVREQENLAGGKNIDRVCSIHAEAQAIAKAAKSGIVTKGATMYVTTLPCLICAKLVTEAGISKVYYSSDYMGGDLAMQIFEANNVEIVQIPITKVLKE